MNASMRFSDEKPKYNGINSRNKQIKKQIKKETKKQRKKKKRRMNVFHTSFLFGIITHCYQYYYYYYDDYFKVVVSMFMLSYVLLCNY